MSATSAGSSPAAAPSQAGAGLYTRQASGLVRDISPGAGIALNVSFISIPLAVLIATQAPSAFPGASPFWVTVFAGVLCIFPTLLYATFTAVMPRAGGDYVFVSRTLHPWVGLRGELQHHRLVPAGDRVLRLPAGAVRLSTAFATIGATAHSATFTRWATDVSPRAGSSGSAPSTLILVAALMSFSLRRALTIYKWLFAISLVGVAIAFVLLLFNGRGDFVNAVARLRRQLQRDHRGRPPGRASPAARTSTSATRCWRCRSRSRRSATRSSPPTRAARSARRRRPAAA